jgi:hypothetical protein
MATIQVKMKEKIKMKKFVSLLITLILVLSLVALTACGDKSNNTDTSTNTDTTSADTTSTDTTSTDTTTDTKTDIDTTTDDGGKVDLPTKSEGKLKYGTYKGTSVYEGDNNGKPFSMTFEILLTLNEDGTFTLTNFSDEDKGNGTFTVNDGVYTLNFGEDKTTNFVVNADGKIQFITTVYYGKASISLDMVGDIILTSTATEPDDTTIDSSETDTTIDNPGNDDKEPVETVYTLAEGTYQGTYTKVSGMGNFVYTYTVVVGADNAISYSVIYTTPFDEGDEPNVGLSYAGTYTLNNNKLVFTTNDEKPITFEGTLTADNTLSIGLQATSQTDRIDTVILEAAK